MVTSRKEPEQKRRWDEAPKCCELEINVFVRECVRTVTVYAGGSTGKVCVCTTHHCPNRVKCLRCVNCKKCK